MTYSVVLFDLDGTLVDTNHLIVQSFLHTLNEQLGLSVTAEELYPYFGEPLPTTLARYAPERALELVDIYRTFNLANHDQLIRQFTGVKEAIMEMHQAGVQLGIVTSKRRDLALRGLRVSGMAEFFQTVVAMDDVEKHKPDPEPALVALRQLDATPGPHVLMVGDSRYDIQCGNSAGLHTAAVAWTLQTRESIDLVEPTHWVESPAELLKLVRG